MNHIKTREELHTLLLQIMNSTNVYFQPPPNVQISIPAISYHISNIYNLMAGGQPYITRSTYNITLMTTNVEPPELTKLLEIPYTRFLNMYTLNNLYYFILSITF